MRAVLQRVTSASVSVNGNIVGTVDNGFLILLGVGRTDGPAEAAALAEKVAKLRVFRDANGKSNLSLLDTGGAALVISQFTLYADCRRGRRPSFSDAADPGPAQALVEEFRAALDRLGVPTAAGQFGAHMTVCLTNDGPYTIALDTETLTVPRRARGHAEGD